MLNKIGCFHLSAPGGSRLDSLQQAIDDAMTQHGEEYLRDSLVVLPEAFNLKGPYTPHRDGYKLESNMKSRLRDIAAPLGIAFVVGLIEEEVTSTQLPYSSAYLISSTSSKLLSRKIGKDSMANGVCGDKLYQPCTTSCDTPQVYCNTCIAGLICMDAVADKFPDDRHSLLIERTQELSADRVVICVPSNMKEFNATGVANDWRKKWPALIFVLANGQPSHVPSIIQIGDRAPVLLQRGNNVLRVEQLEP